MLKPRFEDRREGLEPSKAQDAGGAEADEQACAEVERLTAAIAAGDPEAFGVFYGQWFDRAYSLARSLTRRDESFCLDVVQDAMLRVVRSLRPMSDAAALARWMARVVHTTALDRLRADARRARREERAMARRAADASPRDGPIALELEERAAWLAAQLREMPCEERRLLAERFERGKTFKDAGAALGMTGDAASGRIGRTVSRLRKLAREVSRDGFRNDGA